MALSTPRDQGQIVVEFGSHSIPVKERYVAPLACEGGCFSRR
jgi:hypothetical protein